MNCSFAMSIPGWLIFLLIGSVHTLFYTIFRHGIFEWNADPNINGIDKRRLLKEKRKIIEGKLQNDRPPFAWKVEYYLHVFLGIAIGWIFLWILVDKRIDFFYKPNFKDLGIADLTLFLLGWIGINGRLPSIAHAIVDFMKSGINIGR